LRSVASIASENIFVKPPISEVMMARTPAKGPSPTTGDPYQRPDELVDAADGV
jgi:hypothetical protein